MKKQNQKTDALTTWGWGWVQGEPKMMICLRLKDPTVSQKIMTLPQSQAWYPSSFHCEQGQKVCLLGCMPLNLGSGYQMGYVLPFPRSKGESLVKSNPIGPKWGPHFTCITTLSIPSCPHILPLGLRQGCFCGYSSSSNQRNNLGLETDAALHYSNVFHGASGAPPSPGSTPSCW